MTLNLKNSFISSLGLTSGCANFCVKNKFVKTGEGYFLAPKFEIGRFTGAALIRRGNPTFRQVFVAFLKNLNSIRTGTGKNNSSLAIAFLPSIFSLALTFCVVVSFFEEKIGWFAGSLKWNGTGNPINSIAFLSPIFSPCYFFVTADNTDWKELCFLWRIFLLPLHFHEFFDGADFRFCS